MKNIGAANLRREFNTDGSALAMLDTQRPDDGIRKVLEPAHLQTLLYAARPC